MNKRKVFSMQVDKNNLPCSYSRMRRSTSSTSAACLKIPSTSTPEEFTLFDCNQIILSYKENCVDARIKHKCHDKKK